MGTRDLREAELLKSNSGKREKISILRLFPFCLFCTWQMGIVYFNTAAVSLRAQNNLPFDNSSVIYVVAAGYIVSALFLVLFPSKSAFLCRVFLPLSLLSTAALLLPFTNSLLLIFFAIEAFICVLLTGFITCTIIFWFSFETEVADLLLTMLFSGVVTAVLQNDLFAVSFKAFNIVSLVIQAGLIYFFFTFKPDEGIIFASKAHPVTSPSKLNAGIYLLVIGSCLLLCFGASFTESVKNGISIYYLAGAISAAPFFFFLKRKQVELISIATVFVAISAAGFLLSALSAYYPKLAIPACILLGAGLVVCNLSSILGLFIFSRNASRYVPVIILLGGMVIAMVQSAVFELFKEDHYSRYFVCAVIAILTVLLYMSLSPYLIFAWKKENRLSSPVKSDAAKRGKTAKGGFSSLSGQEQRLAELILSGYSGSEIAELMNITLGTMKNYRINMYQKLCIHSRRELFELYEENEN